MCRNVFFQSHIAVLVLVVWRFFTLVSTALVLFHVCTQGSRLPTPLDSHILVFLMRESWLVTCSFGLYFSICDVRIYFWQFLDCLWKSNIFNYLLTFDLLLSLNALYTLSINPDQISVWYMFSLILKVFIKKDVNSIIWHTKILHFGGLPLIWFLLLFLLLLPSHQEIIANIVTKISNFLLGFS